MPFHIDRVEAELDLLPGAAGEAPSAEAPARPGRDLALRERLRPLVLEIIRDELGRLQRRHG